MIFKEAELGTKRKFPISTITEEDDISVKSISKYIYIFILI